jgi:hypothetical protein
MQNFTSGQKSAKCMWAKPAKRETDSPVPLCPGWNNLPLDLHWSKSRVHKQAEIL